MKPSVSLLMPNHTASVIHYDENHIERLRTKAILDAKIANTSFKSLIQDLKKKGRHEKIQQIRRLSGERFQNNVEAQGLLNSYLYPTRMTLKSNGFNDPILAHKNQGIWSGLLLKRYLNNENVIYYKITYPELYPSGELNMALIERHKAKLSLALTKAGIIKASCSFEVKVSFSQEIGDYVHQIIAHVFNDLNDNVEKRHWAQPHLRHQFSHHNIVTIKNVYNDVKTYADSLKPLSPRTIPLLEKSGDKVRVTKRFLDPCLHLHYIFASMTFEDRLLIHGQTLVRDAKGKYSIK